MFTVEYVTTAKTVCSQNRATFTGATNLARQLRRKGCRSISVNNPSGNEVYVL